MLGATTFDKQARSGLSPVPNTSEKALHDLRSHTSGAGLPPPVRGEFKWPRRRAGLVEQVRAVGCSWMQRPSTSRLEPGSIPVPSTSEKALHDLRSHTSGAGLPPPARGEAP